MTIVVVVLMGAGILLVVSAIECQPIVSTFQSIISGKPIDWTGGNCTSQFNQGMQQPFNPSGPPSKACTSANEGEVSQGYFCHSGKWEQIASI